MSIPFTNLGLRVGEAIRGVTWKGMVEKIREKLVVWKGKHLSFNGRITLLKSTITTVPLYLSMFKLPSKVRNDIKRIQKEFIWA